MKRIITSVFLLVLAFLGISFNAGGTVSENLDKPSKGYTLNIDGAIGPVTYYQVKNIINLAEREEADFVILFIDTPGGLLSSTRKIVQEILSSKTPVIAYVHPRGSQCASAGVFIALACHVAVMSPATNIGAAHPVTLMGDTDEKVEEKVVNDTVSFIKSIASHRGRNVEWAEKAVRESASATETEALEKNVIDAIAGDTEELLSLIHKKPIEMNGEKILLNSENAKLIPHRETFKDRILKVIADPTIAYILLMIGMAGILMEFYTPGLGIAGITGAVALILAFFALHTLPINIAGLILIFLSLIFFAMEAVTASFGLFIISGVVTLILGSFLLFRPMSEIGVSPVFFVWLAVAVSALLFSSLFFVVKTKSRPVATGTEGLLGEKGKAVSDISPEGKIFIHGEYWNAETESEEIKKGDMVVVVGMEGFKLKVKKSG